MKNILTPFTLCTLLLSLTGPLTLQAASSTGRQWTNVDLARRCMTSCADSSCQPPTCPYGSVTMSVHTQSALAGSNQLASLLWLVDRPALEATSPSSLRVRYSRDTLHGYWQSTSTGAPQTVHFESSGGAIHSFSFAEGATSATAKGRTQKDTQILRMLDATGNPTSTNPVKYELSDGSGRLQHYDADRSSPDFGNLIDEVSPSGRKISPADRGYDVLRGTEGEIRQLKGPGLLVDVVVSGTDAMEISYYSEGDFSAVPDASGFYTIPDPSAAFEHHHFHYPEAENLNKIQYIKTTEHGQEVTDFVYVPDSRKWDRQVNKSSDPQATRKHRQEERGLDPDQVGFRSWESRDGDANKYQVQLEQWETIDDEYKLVSRQEDPEGLDLTTDYSYYTNTSEAYRLGRRQSETRPDGSWTAMDYDSQGRQLFELRPWLDAPATVPADPAASLASGDATRYAYTPHDAEDVPEANDHRPRTVTREVLGQVVSRRYYVYGTAADGSRYDIMEQAATPTAAYGAPGNLRSRSDYFGPSAPDWKQGRMKSRLTPDDQLTSYDYERGIWDDVNKTFTVDANGEALRSLVTRGTAGSPAGIAYETTRSLTIQNALGHNVRSETQVYTGSGYETISWQNRSYDVYGEPTQTETSRGELRTMVKRSSCCGLDEMTNAQGITTETQRDGLNRTTARIKKHPTDANQDLITEYTHDPAGRILMEVTRDGANTLSLVSTYSYDGTGRRVQSSPHTGGSSTMSYDDLNRITTQTNADGSTVITQRYLDGRTKSVTGTAVTPQYYVYGVNPDGSQWTQVYTGPALAASPMWSKSTTNLLGQSIQSERPGYNGSVRVSTQSYNDKGQLIESTPAVGASTRYEYDALGDQVASYLDVNGNDSRDNAGPDRITESEDAYVKLGSDWWMESKRYLYDDGNSSATLTGTSRQRLTGLGGTVAGKGTLVAESLSLDIHGNTTTSTRYLDRASQTALSEQDSSLTTASPDSRSVNINGLNVETGSLEPETSTLLATIFDYDALERRLGTTDPRIGRSFVSYVAGKSLLASQTDAAGKVTSFAYYPDTDRRQSVTDPNSNMTHTAYTEDGQVAAIWGAAYPVVYEYDAYDRMENLHTLRDPAVSFSPTVDSKGILTSDVPTLTASMDTTTWLYEESSGLLLEKQYDDSKGPVYTYTSDGRLATRTWERGVVTTYSYVPETLELLSTDYSDSTPDITNSYDRLGRMKTTTDGFGSKTYSFNADLQPTTEVWAGLVNNTLTRVYQPDGRPAGVQLASGYQTAYTYSTQSGHFDTLSYTNTVNGISHSADYAYVANSGMIEGYTLGDLQRTVVYEPNRNLQSTISNLLSSTNTTLSRFVYTNDDGGRRTNREDSGTAFVSTQANVFGYNARSEVVSSVMRNGSSSYSFDEIGNRTTVSVPEEPNPISYTANTLNQYSAIAGNTPSYDDDGNMTDNGDGKTHTWTGENRLEVFTQGDITVESTYDGQGRRVRKLVKDLGVVTSDLRYMYDGWNLLYEIDVHATGTPSRRYVWGLDLSQSMRGAGGVGGLLLTEADSISHAVTYDANGNISEYIDLSSGTIDAHLEYDAFGRTIASTGTAPAPYGFSTKYLDEESGYYYYGFRYYDPETGRWASRDPIEEDGGYNLYGFVVNDGVMFWDVLGMTSALPTAKDIILNKVRSYFNEIEQMAIYEVAELNIFKDKVLEVTSDSRIRYRIIDGWPMPPNADGYYRPATKTLAVRNDYDVKIMVHEIIHARQYLIDGMGGFHNAKQREAEAYIAMSLMDALEYFAELELSLIDASAGFDAESSIAVNYKYQLLARSWQQAWESITTNLRDHKVRGPFGGITTHPTTWVDVWGFQTKFGVFACDRIAAIYNEKLPHNSCIKFSCDRMNEPTEFGDSIGDHEMMGNFQIIYPLSNVSMWNFTDESSPHYPGEWVP